MPFGGMRARSKNFNFSSDSDRELRLSHRSIFWYCQFDIISFNGDDTDSGNEERQVWKQKSIAHIESCYNYSPIFEEPIFVVISCPQRHFLLCSNSKRFLDHNLRLYSHALGNFLISMTLES